MSKEEDVKRACLAWDEAMTRNVVSEIGSYMSDDWICVGTEGGINTKEAFLSWIASGDLAHTTMSSDEMHVKMYGDTAIVVSRGTSAGSYQAAAFSLYEWSSNVFVLRDGNWQCVHTMLTPAKQQ